MRVNSVLETCLYAADLSEAEDFYTRILGLKVIMREEGRHVFFRCGQAVFLVFNVAESTHDDDVPGHGAHGPVHAAFAINEGEIDKWRAHLQDHGVEIEREINWPHGAHSLYFRDPAGNSLEVATPSLWRGKKQKTN